MSTRQFCAIVAVVLVAGASLWAKDVSFRIKILRVASRQIQAPVVTPPDCNWKDLSAYCYSSGPQTYIEHGMVVEEANGKSLEIACTTENQPHCKNLPVNQTFDARRRGHILEVRCPDSHGKMRKQVYEIVGER